MKEFYFILINKKKECLKHLLFLLLTALYCPIRNYINSSFINRFGEQTLPYICRIFFITLISLLLFYVGIKFCNFIKRNRESLVLLGISDSQFFFLFVITNPEILFWQIYWGIILCQICGMNIGLSLLTNGVNALLVYLVGILIGLKLHSKYFSILSFVLIAALGIMIGTQKLTYYTIYEFIMSEFIRLLLFAESFFSITLKSGTIIFLSILIKYLYRKSGEKFLTDNTQSFRTNLLGDFNHKLSIYPGYSQAYREMHKNRDFILWKIFSSILFAIICITSDNNVIVLISAYIICLITAFYFYDIYNFNRTHLFTYFMSNYSYTTLIKDCIVTGIYILGDNILLMLLLRSLVSPCTLIILPIMVICIVIMALYINSELYANYPLKQYNIKTFWALIKLHLPLLNIFFMCKNLKNGRNNWENLNYEQE